MEDGLVHGDVAAYATGKARVLILVVMEDGLVHGNNCTNVEVSVSLNPCCDGRWSRTY